MVTCAWWWWWKLLSLLAASSSSICFLRAHAAHVHRPRQAGQIQSRGWPPSSSMSFP
jgi:hypothetical protein